jgi:hypothetical protein
LWSIHKCKASRTSVHISQQKSISRCGGSNPSSLSKDQIVDCVASILEEMIQDANGSYTQPSEIPNPTLFHAKKQAPISIKDYLKRFAKFSNCHYDAFVYALIYLDKVSNNIENFSLDSFNVYRLVLMCLVSSIKFYDDAYYTNKYYAQMGGVNVEEFNKLEQEFLINYIQFGLYVDVETYSSYYDDLLNYHHKLAQEDSL